MKPFSATPIVCGNCGVFHGVPMGVEHWIGEPDCLVACAEPGIIDICDNRCEDWHRTRGAVQEGEIAAHKSFAVRSAGGDVRTAPMPSELASEALG
jgi:hypothetical protein